MSGNIVSRERRSVMLFGVMGAGAAFVPAWVYANSGNLVTATAFAALGRWRCMADRVPTEEPSSGADNPIRDARHLVPGRGDFRIRIVRAVDPVPCSIEALYADGMPHRCWQAWREGSLLQQSSPISLRWSAPAGEALPLTVRRSDHTSTVFVPAVPGAYVLALAADITAVPAWRALAVRADDRESAKLVLRDTGDDTGLMHWLLEVQTIDT